MTVTVVWFRRDLRLADNRALATALGEGEVVALFVVDPAFDGAGAPRRAMLGRCLQSLHEATDGALVIRHGDPSAVVAAVAREAGARLVVAAEDFGPYGRRRDETVARALADDGVELRFEDTPYAVAPGSVHTGQERPFAVFTPFSRAWAKHGWALPLDLDDAPRWRRLASDPLPLVDDPTAEHHPAGEPAAHERLDAFLDGGLADYPRVRNLPAVDGTSRLSAHLRWGVLHPRQVLAHLGDDEPGRKLRAELAWREFYADVLFHHPQSGWRNLRPQLDGIEVDRDDAARHRFATWQRGATGFPIVDAGMRQLAATGWMHNRLRMVTASFLIKDLHLPWQWGAAHFLDRLVDGDLASNNHGWQWTAGTGTDAAPYFRVFNPSLQADRFDPDGEFRREWIDELGTADYPQPMVDHATERAEALRRYSRVTGQ